MNSLEKPPGKRRFISILLILWISVALLAVVLFNSRPGNLPDQLSWLTPSDSAQLKRVGPLTKLKYKLMNWTAPLWKSYWQNLPQITIKSRVFALPVAMTWPIDSAPPFVIAPNGTRAWILSAEQFKVVQAEIDSLPEAAGTGGPAVITKEGCSAQVSTMNTVGTGTSAVSAGTALFLTPSTADDKIVLTIGFDHTELKINEISGIAGVKTNQAYACRAVFPNDGGLLLENPHPEPGAANHYWLFLSAKAVDANGRLLGQ